MQLYSSPSRNHNLACLVGAEKKKRLYRVIPLPVTTELDFPPPVRYVPDGCVHFFTPWGGRGGGEGLVNGSKWLSAEPYRGWPNLKEIIGIIAS